LEVVVKDFTENSARGLRALLREMIPTRQDVFGQLRGFGVIILAHLVVGIVMRPKNWTDS
jgi:hypothetical protein